MLTTKLQATELPPTKQAPQQSLRNRLLLTKRPSVIASDRVRRFFAHNIFRNRSCVCILGEHKASGIRIPTQGSFGRGDVRRSRKDASSRWNSSSSETCPNNLLSVRASNGCAPLPLQAPDTSGVSHVTLPPRAAISPHHPPATSVGFSTAPSHHERRCLHYTHPSKRSVPQLSSSLREGRTRERPGREARANRSNTNNPFTAFPSPAPRGRLSQWESEATEGVSF